MSRLFPDYRPTWQTEEHSELGTLARDFFAKEATPNQERWAEQQQVDREFWARTGATGLLLTDIGEEYGGAGGDFGHEAVVGTELALAHDTAFGSSVHTIVAHYIANYATEDQKKRWLSEGIAGEKVFAIAMTEPGAGSDLQNISTTAVRDGGDYVINGSKTFITNGSHADLVVIVAKTDKNEGAKGISLLVAETEGLEGFERGRVLDKIGMHGQDTRELSFTDMRVPAENLLGGEEGQGFVQLMNQLPRERLIIAVGGVAQAEAAVLETVDYVKEREAFGKPLMAKQNTQFELADCKADVFAGRTMVDECIRQEIAGELDAITASMAKLWVTDMQCRVIDRCLQLFGGYGYMTEYPIARMYASARVQKIYGGANEIMKLLIGRTL